MNLSWTCRMDMIAFVGERGTRLSGGQKQRISIARVFLKNPPISDFGRSDQCALDNESERRIQQSLEELAKEPDHDYDRTPAFYDPQCG